MSSSTNELETASDPAILGSKDEVPALANELLGRSRSYLAH